MELSDKEQYERKMSLFKSQKKTLDIFLKTGALSEDEYKKSLTGLIEKMNISYKNTQI